MTKARDFFRAFFLVPKPRPYLDKDDVHRFQLANKLHKHALILLSEDNPAG
jgi:hypothetical protein